MAFQLNFRYTSSNTIFFLTFSLVCNAFLHLLEHSVHPSRSSPWREREKLASSLPSSLHHWMRAITSYYSIHSLLFFWTKIRMKWWFAIIPLEPSKKSSSSFQSMFGSKGKEWSISSRCQGVILTSTLPPILWSNNNYTEEKMVHDIWSGGRTESSQKRRFMREDGLDLSWNNTFVHVIWVESFPSSKPGGSTEQGSRSNKWSMNSKCVLVA